MPSGCGCSTRGPAATQTKLEADRLAPCLSLFKALICDYLHTVILFVVLYIFVFTAYGSSPDVGSPGKLWDLLQQAAMDEPVANNAQGSYTTMRSNSGIIFAGCTIAAGFSGVFCDQVSQNCLELQRATDYQ